MPVRGCSNLNLVMNHNLKTKTSVISLHNQQTNVLNFLSQMSAKTIFTLVFIKKNSEVLLGYKTRGFGVGLWNGFGGKVKSEESVLEGAKRELKEESNLDVSNLRQLGVVTYKDENNPEKSVVHIFTADSYRGVIKASEEMNPIQWYNHSDIPYNRMWPDARLWYPLMLSGKYFAAVIGYGSDGNIKDVNIKEYNDIQNIFKRGL